MICQEGPFASVKYTIFFVIHTNHGDKAPYELKILEVVRVDVGCRVDLQTVVIFAGIFKEAIHGVQDLMREQEEPLPRREITTKCGEECKTAANHGRSDKPLRKETNLKENRTKFSRKVHQRKTSRTPTSIYYFTLGLCLK